jgi:hypothetical protein
LNRFFAHGRIVSRLPARKNKVSPGSRPEESLEGPVPLVLFEQRVEA